MGIVEAASKGAEASLEAACVEIVRNECGIRAEFVNPLLIVCLFLSVYLSVCVCVRQCVNVYVCVVCAHLFDEMQKHSAQCFELLLA